MGKRCCECRKEINNRTAYYFEKREACSARCAALSSIKSLKNPGNLEKKPYNELIENDSSLTAKANTKAK